MKRIAKMRRPTSRARVETIELPKSDCAIIPPKQKRQTRFDNFEQFVFETVLRLIALHLIDSRMPAAKGLPESQGTGLRLWRERVDHSVHSSPCALHRTVRDVFSGNSRTFRHVPRRAGRPSLNAVNAANAKAEREKY